jgi:hypothetical protein
MANIFEQSQALMQGAGNTYADVQAPGAIARSMNQYINPYQQQVIDQTVGRMTDDRNNALMRVGANAGAAGAFGGSRHGLVESRMYDNSNRAIGEQVGNLSLQGFNTAAGLGAQDVNNQLAAAGGAANLGGMGFNQGMMVNQQQLQHGNQQQSLMQQILSGASRDFSGLLQHPYDMLNMQLAAAGQNPLMGNQSQQYTPGLFDYLSLAAQTAGGLGSGGYFN